jgi:hypothetical protein
LFINTSNAELKGGNNKFKKSIPKKETTKEAPQKEMKIEKVETTKIKTAPRQLNAKEQRSKKVTENAANRPVVLKSYDDYVAGSLNTPAINKEVLKSIKTPALSHNWKEYFSKVKIVSDKWSIEKNEYKGNILERGLKTLCYASKPNGSCVAHVISLYHDYLGSNKYKSTFSTVGAVS